MRVAQQLYNAKQLESYEDTVGTFRELYKTRQGAELSEVQGQDNALFSQELESQRGEIVQSIEGVNDIAGAPVTAEMKEFLLHDIMELNAREDPILMEEVFSSPENMFKVNWFLKYGEDYIGSLNEYWKKEVSKAHKTAYNDLIEGMPRGSAVMGVGAARQQGGAKPGEPGGFGKELTEEELFEDN